MPQDWAPSTTQTSPLQPIVCDHVESSCPLLDSAPILPRTLHLMKMSRQPFWLKTNSYRTAILAQVSPRLAFLTQFQIILTSTAYYPTGMSEVSLCRTRFSCHDHLVHDDHTCSEQSGLGCSILDECSQTFGLILVHGTVPLNVLGQSYYLLRIIGPSYKRKLPMIDTLNMMQSCWPQPTGAGRDPGVC
jgi:hypothetical protein